MAYSFQPEAPTFATSSHNNDASRQPAACKLRSLEVPKSYSLPLLCQKNGLVMAKGACLQYAHLDQI